MKKEGPHIIPGTEFICTRDLIIYPKDYFLDCGIYGALGYYLFPRCTEPYLGYSLIFPAFIPESILLNIQEMLNYDSTKEARFNLCRYGVKEFLFRIGMAQSGSKTGSKILDTALKRRPIPSEIFRHIPKKRRDRPSSSSQ